MYNKDLELLSRKLGIQRREDEDKYTKGNEEYATPNQNFADNPMQHTPLQMMPPAGDLQSRPKQMPYTGDGNTSAINIQYTTADGTQYQMSVITPDKNKGKALQNVLAGLYSVMMSEGGQNMPKYEK